MTPCSTLGRRARSKKKRGTTVAVETRGAPSYPAGRPTRLRAGAAAQSTRTRSSPPAQRAQGLEANWVKGGRREKSPRPYFTTYYYFLFLMLFSSVLSSLEQFTDIGYLLLPARTLLKPTTEDGRHTHRRRGNSGEVQAAEQPNSLSEGA